MANRRFEMHQYRQVLVRMRLGESDRQIAKAGLMGRTKAAAFRRTAASQGWLSAEHPVPDAAAFAEVFGKKSLALSPSSALVAPHCDEITAWFRQFAPAGVGIATGSDSFFVVDVDMKNG